MTKYLIMACVLAFCTFAFFQIEKSDGVEYRKIIAGHQAEVEALAGQLAETEAKLEENAEEEGTHPDAQ